MKCYLGCNPNQGKCVVNCQVKKTVELLFVVPETNSTKINCSVNDVRKALMLKDECCSASLELNLPWDPLLGKKVLFIKRSMIWHITKFQKC